MSVKICGYSGDERGFYCCYLGCRKKLMFLIHIARKSTMRGVTERIPDVLKALGVVNKSEDFT